MDAEITLRVDGTAHRLTVDTRTGEFLGRAFGGMMLAMSTAGYFAPESEGVMKMYAVAEALFTPLLIKNIKDESGSMKTGMWKLQALMHIPLAALSLYKAFGPKDE